jgi:hypothetical protein
MRRPRVSPALRQAILRAARTILAAGIAAALTEVPQLVGVFHLDPIANSVIITAIAGFLNGVGKLIRGASVDANPGMPGDALPF